MFVVAAMRSALEEDNDRMVSDLERKVAALKGATQSIHDEVSEQNRMLGGMVRVLSLSLSVCACEPILIMLARRHRRPSYTMYERLHEPRRACQISLCRIPVQSSPPAAAAAAVRRRL